MRRTRIPANYLRDRIGRRVRYDVDKQTQERQTLTRLRGLFRTWPYRPAGFRRYHSRVNRELKFFSRI